MIQKQAIPTVDFTSAAFKADPYPYYANLRTYAPVHPVEKFFRGQRAWLVSRYEDAVEVLKADEIFVKNPKNAMTPEQYKKAPKMPFKSLSSNLLSVDVPDHTRLKALVHKAFSPRTVEQMRLQTDSLTMQLLDQMDAKHKRGESIDLIADYALPLPLTIIGRMLGVPDADKDKFHRWTQNFVAIGGSGSFGAILRMPGIVRFANYLRQIVRERTRNPKDDLISSLVAAREQDDQLTEDEVVAMVFLLLSAGHETTVNLIGSGLLALLQHRDQWDRLHANPEMIKSAVEELLRFVTPAEMATERYAATTTTIAGVEIPRGDLVFVLIASANRDEHRFDNPEVVDIGRQNNKHISFGQGIHYCVGAPLSRLEGQIAIPALIERFPNLTLSVPEDKLRWRSNVVLRGLEALPVKL